MSGGKKRSSKDLAAKNLNSNGRQRSVAVPRRKFGLKSRLRGLFGRWKGTKKSTSKSGNSGQPPSRISRDKAGSNNGTNSMQTPGNADTISDSESIPQLGGESDKGSPAEFASNQAETMTRSFSTLSINNRSGQKKTSHNLRRMNNSSNSSATPLSRLRMSQSKPVAEAIPENGELSTPNSDKLLSPSSRNTLASPSESLNASDTEQGNENYGNSSSQPLMNTSRVSNGSSARRWSANFEQEKLDRFRMTTSLVDDFVDFGQGEAPIKKRAIVIDATMDGKPYSDFSKSVVLALEAEKLVSDRVLGVIRNQSCKAIDVEIDARGIVLMIALVRGANPPTVANARIGYSQALTKGIEMGFTSFLMGPCFQLEKLNQEFSDALLHTINMEVYQHADKAIQVKVYTNKDSESYQLLAKTWKMIENRQKGGGA